MKAGGRGGVGVDFGRGGDVVGLDAAAVCAGPLGRSCMRTSAGGASGRRSEVEDILVDAVVDRGRRVGTFGALLLMLVYGLQRDRIA